jgi:Icc-related predicted phosphoesterase
MRCFFVTDIHGSATRFAALFAAIRDERPDAVFVGGDLLPAFGAGAPFDEVFFGALRRLRGDLGPAAPRVFVILGNDDPRVLERDFEDADREGLLEYVHGRRTALGAFEVYGYACIPPTPFGLKDWEKWDVSRFLDGGCLSPEEGTRTVPLPESEIRYGTIAADLAALAGARDQAAAIWLFHAPPHRTGLDRLGRPRLAEGLTQDPHVGSIAIRRFLEDRGPAVSLHGHIHESARVTGSFKDRIGRTVCLSAAHDGPELALVTFEPECPEAASRRLLPV